MRYLRLGFSIILLLIFNSCLVYDNFCSWELDKKDMIYNNHKNKIDCKLQRYERFIAIPFLLISLSRKDDFYYMDFTFIPDDDQDSVIRISDFRFSIYDINNIMILKDSINLVESLLKRLILFEVSPLDQLSLPQFNTYFHKDQIIIKNLRKRQDGESLWFDFEITLHFSNGKTSKLYYKKEKIIKTRYKYFGLIDVI